MAVNEEKGPQLEHLSNCPTCDLPRVIIDLWHNPPDDENELNDIIMRFAELQNQQDGGRKRRQKRRKRTRKKRTKKKRKKKTKKN